MASRDFHSETSIIVPSRARMMIGVRSVTSASLRNVWNPISHQVQRFVFLPGLGTIGDNDNDPVHNSDIMISIFPEGKQFDHWDAEVPELARSKRFVETMTD